MFCRFPLYCWKVGSIPLWAVVHLLYCSHVLLPFQVSDASSERFFSTVAVKGTDISTYLTKTAYGDARIMPFPPCYLEIHMCCSNPVGMILKYVTQLQYRKVSSYKGCWGFFFFCVFGTWNVKPCAMLVTLYWDVAGLWLRHLFMASV